VNARAQDEALNGLRQTHTRRLSVEFEVCGEIGRGSFSIVMRVRHRLDGSMYAVKRTSRPLTNNTDRLSALQEVFALAALRHPNVIKFHGAWFEDRCERLFIQTDLYPKGSLEQNAENVRRTPECLTDLFLAMASALAYMHSKHIVHLDVKPENLFLCETNKYVLGDFGMSCMLDGSNYSGLDGDARYLCPELMASHGFDGKPNGKLDKLLPAADVFAMGVTMIEVALGTPMTSGGKTWSEIREGHFATGPNFGKLRKQCGGELADLIARCVKRDISKRPAASEIEEHLIQRGSTLPEIQVLKKRLSAAEEARDRSKERANQLESVLEAIMASSSGIPSKSDS